MEILKVLIDEAKLNKRAEAMANKKKEKYGGFDRGIFLEEIGYIN